MKSKFVTSFIFGSALTLGALSFVACGEDSVNALPQPGQSAGTSSSSQYVEPDITKETFISFSNFTATPSFSIIQFDGSITINFGDTNTIADVDAVRLQDVKFAIVKAGTKNLQGKVTVLRPIDFENNFTVTANLDEMGVRTDLDEGYTECGDFELIVTAFATDDINESVSEKRILFTRSEEKCREPESSSSSEPEATSAPLDSFHVTIDTKIHKCINTITKAPDDAGDICFLPNSNQTIDLYSTTGVKFALFNNMNDRIMANDYAKDYLPEDPHTSDFLYVSTSLVETYTNFFSHKNDFFVAISPTYDSSSEVATGFFAFIVLDYTIPDSNGNLSMDLLVYTGK